jgi:hypothetical protein
MLKTAFARKSLPAEGSLTIRLATADDEVSLAHLAELDSSRTPRGAVLVAQVENEIWAALSVDDGHGVADPFRPSAEALWMLTERSRQLRKEYRGRLQHFTRVWPAGA